HRSYPAAVASQCPRHPWRGVPWEGPPSSFYGGMRASAAGSPSGHGTHDTTGHDEASPLARGWAGRFSVPAPPPPPARRRVVAPALRDPGPRAARPADAPDRPSPERERRDEARIRAVQGADVVHGPGHGVCDQGGGDLLGDGAEHAVQLLPLRGIERAGGEPLPQQRLVEESGHAIVHLTGGVTRLPRDDREGDVPSAVLGPGGGGEAGGVQLLSVGG